jgi:signal peptidase II
MSRLRRLEAWAVVAAIVLILDQLTKWWAVSALDTRDIDVVWTLRFHLSYNTGMAFSAGQDWGPVIGVVAMVIIVVLLLNIRRDGGRFTDISVGMVVGGAVGNVVDRLFRSPGWLRGGVVDFIDFQWFPIFNVADMGITVGGVLIVLSSWWTTRQAEQT